MKHLSQMPKNIPKKRLKIAGKFVMFRRLGVTGWCYTSVLHLKYPILGIKKPFTNKGLRLIWWAR